MNIENFKLETERLLLVPIDIKYKDEIFAEFTREVAKYLVPQPSGKIEDTISFINNAQAENIAGKNLQLVALNKETKEFVGCLGLHRIDTKIPELGLWFKQSVWGLGCGKESMLALKQWAEKNLEYESIVYPVFKKNLPSKKIAEFLGRKTDREFMSKNFKGEEFETLEYMIDRL